MPTFRTVTGTIELVNNRPLKQAVIIFDYYNLSSINNRFFNPTRVTAIANEQGEFSIQLWCNEEGEENSFYRCTIPNAKPFDFVLPIGTTPIPLEVLKQGGITPIDPQYQSLLSYIQSSIGVQKSKEVFTTNANQSSFLLQTAVPSPHLTQLFLNGVQQAFGIDYNIDGSAINWISAIALQSGWRLEIYY